MRTGTLIALPLFSLLHRLPARFGADRSWPHRTARKAGHCLRLHPCPISEGDEIPVCARQGEGGALSHPGRAAPRGNRLHQERELDQPRPLDRICCVSGIAELLASRRGRFHWLLPRKSRRKPKQNARRWVTRAERFVAAERAKRLGNNRRGPKEIEAQAKAEEKAKAEFAAAAPATG